jgi:F-type H+-transporting ATPase subunit b
MHPLALVAMAAGGGGRIGEIASTFGVDWPHLMAQIISFCIVCALLQRFAYKPVLKVLQDRRQQIAQGLADAQKMKADLAQTEMRRQEILMQANAQASQMIDEAHAAAARVQQQETQKAIAAAEQIIVKARETTEKEHARMFAELKRELGRLVVQTTATVTGKILTPEDQRRLAEEASRRLAV